MSTCIPNELMRVKINSLLIFQTNIIKRYTNVYGETGRPRKTYCTAKIIKLPI